LDVAAIQAELDTQKIDYNHELTTIGIGNLFSGLLGGATGSYIFSQTIFSAKRAVKSRMNGVVVLVGEFLLFLWPVDILQFFPNSYVGGIMCLLGIDIMKDWLISSRALMSRAEFLLVWLSFAITLWLTSIETFGVIEGMAVGTLVASLVFAIQYSRDHVSWTVLQNRSSVVRPPRERRKLAEDSGSILAVTLNSFAFFGASLYMSQAIEAEVRSRRPRYVCLDFGRLNGIDSTAADQLRLLALSLERLGCMIRLSSMRSTTVKRLLEAHGVVSDTRDRPVFSTIDLAVQHCEEAILAECRTLSRAKSQEEQPLQQLLLDYVDGFLVTSVSIEAAALNARELCAHFDRCVIAPGAFVFRKEELCDAIYVIAAGTLSMYIDQGTRQNDRSGSSNDSPLTLWSPQSKPLQTCQTKSALDLDACDKPEQAVDLHAPEESLVQSTGVGGILGDTAFYARRVYGIDAWAGESGCVLHRISRKRIDELEITSPGLVAFLQKVVLRDLTQLQVQYLGPLQIASGLN
jgi:SulP family sulfate permease